MNTGVLTVYVYSSSWFALKMTIALRVRNKIVLFLRFRLYSVYSIKHSKSSRAYFTINNYGTRNSHYRFSKTPVLIVKRKVCGGTYSRGERCPRWGSPRPLRDFIKIRCNVFVVETRNHNVDGTTSGNEYRRNSYGIQSFLKHVEKLIIPILLF